MESLDCALTPLSLAQSHTLCSHSLQLKSLGFPHPKSARESTGDNTSGGQLPFLTSSLAAHPHPPCFLSYLWLPSQKVVAAVDGQAGSPSLPAPMGQCWQPQVSQDRQERETGI